jgi:hypothetical protein
MSDDWVFLGKNDRIIEVSLEKIPEPRVLDTRMTRSESRVGKPQMLKGVYSLQSEVDGRSCGPRLTFAGCMCSSVT